MLKKYDVKGKRVLVHGSLDPWAEAIAIKFGASEVITVEYGKIQVDWKDSPAKLAAYTPYEAYDMVLSGSWEPVDFIISYSSIEHDGLGRYGDPLNPEGDLITADRLSCLIKKDGIMLLGVPTGPDTLVWNAHRVYG